jgi:hypothetical protein
VPRGILYVETRPSSAERLQEYSTWYNETHLPEVVAMEGFVSGRRYEPVGHDGPFVAIYEIDADDIGEVRSRVLEAMKAGDAYTRANGVVQRDPPPLARFFREIAVDDPGAVSADDA